jgi:hypothetical protein
MGKRPMRMKLGKGKYTDRSNRVCVDLSDREKALEDCFYYTPSRLPSGHLFKAWIYNVFLTKTMDGVLFCYSSIMLQIQLS